MFKHSQSKKAILWSDGMKEGAYSVAETQKPLNFNHAGELTVQVHLIELVKIYIMTI